MIKKMTGIISIIFLLGVTLVSANLLTSETPPTSVADSASHAGHDHSITASPTSVSSARQPLTPQLFQPGQDYRVLSEPVSTDANTRNIEVTSVFWYGCPHCYALEPHIEQWQHTLSADVEFIRRPGFFAPNLWQTHARLYYTIRNMGLEQQVHAGIFSEIQNRRNKLHNSEVIAEFLNREYGVEPEAFNREFTSFSVNNQLQQAFVKLKGYQLSGVPAIIIDGRYVVEPGLAGSLGNMPVIADFLIRKVRQEREESVESS